MSTEAKKILSALGNDAKAWRDTESIVASLLDGKDSSLSNGFYYLSFPLRLLVFLRFLILPLLLPFYWISLLATFLRLIFLKGSREKPMAVLPQAVFDRLMMHWGKYPYHFFTKALEAIYFSREDIRGPSLEIGIYTGETSLAVFYGKKIDYGMEFVPQNLARFSEKRQSIYQQFFCGDIYNVPFPNNSLQSVYIVHSLDDIERGLEGALVECRRVLRSDGHLIFSLYSHRFLDNNIVVRMLSRMGLRKSANRLFKALFPGTHNCFSAEDWRELLPRHGFEVDEVHYFLPVGFARFIDLPFRLEGILINLFGFHSLVTPWLQFGRLKQAYSKALFRAISSLYLQCQTGRVEGINVFIKASKIHQSDESQLAVVPHYACPVCHQLLSEEQNEQLKGYLCHECRIIYPQWKGFPLLLSQSGLTMGREKTPRVPQVC